MLTMLAKFSKNTKTIFLWEASKDSEPDVASRHDDYLAMQDPHGTT